MAANNNASERRMAAPGSENWHAMLDSAEEILRDDGHAQLTSRSIAERTGVKQRLLYYYFRTMDDLIVAMFRRRSERELTRLRDAIKSENALREIWDTNVSSTDTRLISEFMALANRIDDLRDEVIRFIEESRAIEIEAIQAALARRSAPSAISAPGLALIATSVALSLSREAQLGIDMGHRDVMEVIDQFISSVEP
jgi:AcrR family transcriptional regulator